MNYLILIDFFFSFTFNYTNKYSLIVIDFRQPSMEKPSHMLDLLDVNLGEASGGGGGGSGNSSQHHQQQVDPWGVPIAPPPPRPQVIIIFNILILYELLSPIVFSCKFIIICMKYQLFLHLHDTQSLDLSLYYDSKVCNLNYEFINMHKYLVLFLLLNKLNYFIEIW